MQAHKQVPNEVLTRNCRVTGTSLAARPNQIKRFYFKGKYVSLLKQNINCTHF